jgi:hypothetical protein
MAKKELNFGKLGLPQKATIIKKEEETTPNIEKAIEKIHGETQKGRVVVETPPPAPVAKAVTPPPPSVVKPVAKSAAKTEVQAIELDEMMPVKKISMDLPLDVYKYLKINSFDRAMTMKDYVLRLIEADMKR